MKTMSEKEEEAAELIRRTIPPSLWKSCTILQKKKAVPDRREIDSEYGEDVSRLPLFTNRLDPGCVKNVKTIQRISSSSWGRRGTGSPDGRERSGISETGLRGAAGSADGTFPGRGRRRRNLIRVEGILRPYSQKIVRKRLRKRYVLAEVGLFGRRETVLFGICLPGDRIWEGRR